MNDIISIQKVQLQQMDQQLLDARRQIQSLEQNLRLAKGARGQDASLLQTLRDKLVSRINSYELNLNEQTRNLQLRLEKREMELDQVKQLFVDKLRELESNFAEIGDHLIANQKK